jgi:hypothetical protein
MAWRSYFFGSVRSACGHSPRRGNTNQYQYQHQYRAKYAPEAEIQ